MAGEGVTGLKELGAREMSYRLLFIACSVKVGACGGWWSLGGGVVAVPSAWHPPHVSLQQLRAGQRC
jgi:hypothetical protein